MNAVEIAKQAAAHAAISYVAPGEVLGVGTGSTVRFFIEALSDAGVREAVATSDDTERLLGKQGIVVRALEEIDAPLYLYVDGADEIDHAGRAIKGGGGAHAREKEVACAARTWVCIVDDSKPVSLLGSHAPVPLEVRASRVAEVSSAIEAMGASAQRREGALTDAGNLLLDVLGLDLSKPEHVERRLEMIPGVVGCGIFALRRADIVLVGHADGFVDTVHPARAGSDREAGSDDPDGETA